MIKHNVYFEGNVQSLGFESDIGYATIGVMKPGKYVFSTSTKEKMIVTSGIMQVILPGEERKEVKQGESFQIAANQSFQVFITSDVTYLCYYE